VLTVGSCGVNIGTPARLKARGVRLGFIRRPLIVSQLSLNLAVSCRYTPTWLTARHDAFTSSGQLQLLKLLRYIVRTCGL
jgi:hypothetical protein